MSSKTDVHFSRESAEHHTPPEIVAAATIWGGGDLSTFAEAFGVESVIRGRFS